MPECSLFEYDCSKGRVISKLKYLNKYEICDCIARCLSRQQTIVRFDRRVVIDLSRMQEFDGQGDSPSAKYIRQLLHRLLICDTVKQFLCVHNNSSYDRYQNNYLI